jgi:hypothetical protein
MPPAYDDIGDAFALVQDGTTHSVALDNQGATMETNEATYGDNFEGVWVMFDLSAFPDGFPVDITLDLVKTGGDAGFKPYISVLGVLDPTFDPGSPDFSKLDWTSAESGDNTDDPPAEIWTLVGGTGTDPADEGSQTGIFYAHFVDWNYTYYGAATLDYKVDATPICVEAEDVLNPDSPTASVVSARVRETFDQWWDDDFVIENQRDAALTWAWSGPAGNYQVFATGRFTNPGGATWGSGGARVLVAVNGVPFISVLPNAFSAFGTDETWAQYNGLNGGGTYDDDGTQAPWIPVSPGDTIEVFIVSNGVTSLSAWVPFDLERVCFQEDPDAPGSLYCTPTFQFPTDPLGDQWGSANGWGGQQFVPDEIWTLLGITPYDEAEFPWGVNWADYDFSALEDGTVYAIVHDSWAAGAGTPSTSYSYIVVKKYDPGSDTWSQVDTINIRTPTDRYPAEAVSCEYDGTYVYLVWWEVDTFTAGAPNKYLWKWHCKRLDPSDDSITELGSGQNSEGVTTQPQNYPGSVLACGIACEGSGGDVYVSEIEEIDNAGSDQRLYAWRWNGSSWADTSLPDPSVTATGWDIIGENSFYDVLGPMVMAKQDGPSTDGPTLVYTYRIPSGSSGSGNNENRTVTIEYEVGTGWINEILTDWTDVESDARLGLTTPLAHSIMGIDMNIMWSENLGRLVLATDLLPNVSTPGIWDVLQMNDGGTQWEPVSDAAPGDVTGGWRESRNTAAIGPDGEVYRAMFMDSADVVNFEPKIAKTAPGFAADFSVATSVSMGEGAWQPWMFATTNYRIRIVGQDAYVMCNLQVQDWDYDTDTWPGNQGEGIYVFKLTYSDCVTFVPHIYRLVFDS